jgi:hypothetical protein
MKEINYAPWDSHQLWIKPFEEWFQARYQRTRGFMKEIVAA